MFKRRFFEGIMRGLVKHPNREVREVVERQVDEMRFDRAKVVGGEVETTLKRLKGGVETDE